MQGPPGSGAAYSLRRTRGGRVARYSNRSREGGGSDDDDEDERGDCAVTAAPSAPAPSPPPIPPIPPPAVLVIFPVGGARAVDPGWTEDSRPLLELGRRGVVGWFCDMVMCFGFGCSCRKVLVA